ncbi:MAG: STAS domain-containing protein [Leptospirales bacterium]|nr:STAS domain-containing protein [Leptospirales bacterium]
MESIPETREPSILSVAGAMDAKCIASLQERIRELCARGEAEMVLDMEAVSKIESCAVAGLIECVSMLRKRGGDLSLSGLKTEALHVFDAARLLSIFAVHDNDHSQDL